MPSAVPATSNAKAAGPKRVPATRSTASPNQTIPQAPRTLTMPLGIGFWGLTLASRSASTISFSAPIAS